MQPSVRLLMLGLISALAIPPEAASQDLMLTLDLQPGVVPAGGGTVTVRTTIDNQTNIAQTVDFWMEVVRPDGIVKKHGPRTVELPPLDISGTSKELVMRDGNPAGEYSVVCYIGNYPDKVIDSDTMSFSKLDSVQLLETKLIASDGATSDYFGSSVSMSGDYAVIGALENGDGGSAYVFRHDGTTWVEEAKLIASDAHLGDLFGCSVSIAGDYAVIGARGADDGGYFGSGCAYVFHRVGATWVQDAKITASDAYATDEFGVSVSISGDYAVIGAWGDDDNGPSSGSAYIFHRNGTSWVQEAKLTASDGAAYDWFGKSVSISGDYVLIGAYEDDDNGFESGSAYIFHRDGDNWIDKSKLTASDGAHVENFGWSVSISGDYVLIGAYEDNDNGTGSGSAYIFHRNGTTWVEEAKLTASDGAAFDNFGFSVSISGDYVVIGAIQDGDNGFESGSAYIFYRDGSTWTEKAKLTASDGAENDWLGFSVSISGDYVVIGAFLDDDNGIDSGSSYIYSGFSGMSSPSGAGPEIQTIPLGKDALPSTEIEGIPDEMSLGQNYPNPFNPSTTFRYGLSEPGQVTLSVYDMLGQLVKTMVNDYQAEGYHEAIWDGRNESGVRVASGIYIYRMSVVPTARRDLVPQEGDGTAGTFTATKRMLLLK